ncbi:hypothetical protein UXO13_11260 [Enterobacter bugandensis]|uniref:hypothetical protein n=1 Tax=Enterobacter TaxID=547 RepID=UPI000F81EA11|nr:hypothetical protein [Enterobacter asburiae]RTN79490.1 hypothetical protein EKN81_12265 [Enterobacter asburiae]RTP78276.1 hypothetical protein EKN32_12260 [Enterobacter asburiae]
MSNAENVISRINNTPCSVTKNASSTYNIAKGEIGERLIREILDAWGTFYFSIEQNKHTMPKWISEIGGKRPDFLAFAGDDNQIILIDSKFYKNYNGFFYLETVEITRYANLINHLGDRGINVEVLFLFPIGGAAGHSFYAYSLNDAIESSELDIDNITNKQLKAETVFTL